MIAILIGAMILILLGVITLRIPAAYLIMASGVAPEYASNLELLKFVMFGGLGQNFMNPALGGRCFLLIAFAADMTNFKSSKFEAYSGATPLAMIRNEGLSSVNVMDMLTGKIPGTIGETSVIAILIGAMILILLGVITLRIPAAYLITFAVFMLIFGKEPMNANYQVSSRNP